MIPHTKDTDLTCTGPVRDAPFEVVGVNDERSGAPQDETWVYRVRISLVRRR